MGRMVITNYARSIEVLQSSVPDLFWRKGLLPVHAPYVHCIKQAKPDHEYWIAEIDQLVGVQLH